jgi:soluble lytic murein transglycosylase
VILIISLAILGGILLNSFWNLFDRTTPPDDYKALVEKYSAEYDIPKDLILAVINVESSFNPYAESSSGALGLMQMMPATFEWLTGDEHLAEHLAFRQLTDPDVSIRYGVYYLRYLAQKFDYNWSTVCAAYNGGEGNVMKWLADPQYSDGQGNLTYIPLEETRNYVSKVENAIKLYQDETFETKGINDHEQHQ